MVERNFKEALEKEVAGAVAEMKKEFNRLAPSPGFSPPTPWWRRKYYKVRYRVRNGREHLALWIAPWLEKDRW